MNERDSLYQALNDLEAEIATLIARRAALPAYPGDDIDYLKGRVLEMRARRNGIAANVENRLAAFATGLVQGVVATVTNYNPATDQIETRAVPASEFLLTPGYADREPDVVGPNLTATEVLARRGEQHVAVAQRADVFVSVERQRADLERRLAADFEEAHEQPVRAE